MWPSLVVFPRPFQQPCQQPTTTTDAIVADSVLCAVQEWLQEQAAYMQTIYGRALEPKTFTTQMQENEQVIDIREEPYTG